MTGSLLESVMDAQEEVKASGFDPDVLFLSKTAEEDILDEHEWGDDFYLRDDDGNPLGAAERVMGMEVRVTHWLGGHRMMVADSSHYGTESDASVLI